MIKTKAFALILVSLLLVGGFTGMVMASKGNDTGVNEAHGSIRIDSDSEFLSLASSEGWPGDGSAGNPYVIENYSIDAGGSGSAIYIGNVTLHFSVINCTLRNATHISDPYLRGTGITLYNTTNASISNNIVSNNSWYGIEIWDEIGSTLDMNTSVDSNTISGNWHGIYLYAAHNVSIENNTVDNNSANGFVISSSSENIIENNTVPDNGADGVSISLHSIGNEVVGNSILSSGRYGIIISDYADSNIIEGNTVKDSANHGIYVGGSGGNSIINNTIQNNSLSAVYMDSCRNTMMRGNIMYGGGVAIWGNSLSYWNTHDIDASNTVNGGPLYYYTNLTGFSTPSDAGQVLVANCAGGNISGVNISNLFMGVEVGYSSGVHMENLSIDSVHDEGIYMLYSLNCQIKNSSINSSYYGILMSYSDSNGVEWDEIRNCYNGIYFSDSDGNSIENSTFSHNRGDVIYMRNSCSSTRIINNTIVLNDGAGIYMSPSIDGVIANNNISQNRYGIYLRYSTCTGNEIYGNQIWNNSNYAFYFYYATENRIYHNNILANRNAVSSGYNNTWNLTYPDGGNYWSDYSGDDIFMGPGQDQQGQDGIGDVPYNITGGDRMDFYPLMKPWNGTVPSDTEAPVILGSAPADNGSGVSVTQNVVISFSEFINTSTLAYTCTPDPGNWSLSWSSGSSDLIMGHNDFLYDQAYNLTISSGKDMSGKDLINVPYYISFTTEPDTNPPFVVISSPSNGSFMNSSAVTVYWNGSDGETGLDHYDVSVDGTSWIGAGLSTNMTGTYSEGLHNFRVRATDMAGNTAISYVEFTVDTVLPIVSISNPEDGSFIQSTSLTVYWNGSDTSSGIDHYDIRLDGASWTDVGTSTQYDMNGLLQGNHTFDVRATDRAGHTSTDSVHFIVDTIDPELRIDSPTQQALLNVTTVTINWTGWDNQSGIEHYNLSLDRGNTWIDVGLNTTYVASNLADGWYQFAVMAFDRAGLSSRKDVLVEIDSTPPELRITQPGYGDAFNVSHVSIAWDVFHHKLAELSLDGSPWTDAGDSGGVELENLSEGRHEFRVRAVDDAGNWNRTSVEFIIDLTSPKMTVTYPMDIALSTYNITFTWNATDEVSGMSDKYGIQMDNGEWLYYENEGNRFNWSMYLPDGNHTLHLRVFDRAGNMFENSTNFTIDTGAPTIYFRIPEFCNSTEMEVNWTARDLTGIDHYEVSVDGETPVDVGLSDHYNITGISEGEHSITIFAYDTLGNNGSVMARFTADFTAPHIWITSPDEGTVTGDANIRISWSAEDVSGVAYYLYRLDDGEWKNMTETHIVESVDSAGNDVTSHTVYVIAYDSTGHHAMATRNFTTDYAPPSIVSYSPQGDDADSHAVISIVFDEAINMSRESHHVHGVGIVEDYMEQDYTMNAVWDEANLTLNLIPPENGYGSAYSITVELLVMDTTNNMKMTEFNWTFSTSAEPGDMGQITGILVDEDGNPIADAALVYNDLVMNITGEDGSFVISAPGGEMTLTVLGETESGSFKMGTAQMTITSGKKTDLGTVVMTPSDDAGDDEGGLGDISSSSSMMLIGLLLLVLIGALAFFMMKKKSSGPEETEEEPEEEQELESEEEMAEEMEEPSEEEI